MSKVYLEYRQISLIGSIMGNHHDYLQAMQLVFTKKMTPVIHCIVLLAQGMEAMVTLERGEQFGKIVLTQE